MAINIPKATNPTTDPIQDDAFEKIRKVLELARRLAVEDHQRHIIAIKDATTSEETKDTLTQLHASDIAFMKIDVAYKSLISAESDFRGTTVNLLQGDHEKAKEQALNSSAHLGDVAENLKAYGEAIPQSKFFASALTAITNADRIIGKVEDNISMTVDRFSAGLDNFANRINEMKDDVAKFPSVVIDKVKSTGESMIAAIKSAGSKLMEKFQAGDSRNVFTEKETTDKVSQVDKPALNMLDQFSNGFNSKKQNLINSISDHIATIGSYGQDALEYAEGKIRKISESYTSRLAQTKGFNELGSNSNISRVLDRDKVNEAIGTFYNKKNSTPRQALYTRLISDFLVETDSEKKNQYIHTMRNMVNQPGQTRVEKQNASDSFEYMLVALSETLPHGHKNALSTDGMSIDKAMEMLDDIKGDQIFNAIKVNQSEEMESSPSSPFPSNPFPYFSDARNINENKEIRDSIFDIDPELQMEKWHMPQKDNNTASSLPDAPSLEEQAILEEVKNQSLRDRAFDTDPVFDFDSSSMEKLDKIVVSYPPPEPPSMQESLRDRAFDTDPVFDFDPSSMEKLDKIVVSYPPPEPPSMQEEPAKPHMEAPIESISDFKNRMRENLANQSNKENSAPRERG